MGAGLFETRRTATLEAFVARSMSGDRSGDVTYGTVEGPQESADGRGREQSAHERLNAAVRRDEIAHARDLAALSRDLAADMRDLVMQQDQAATEHDEDSCAITSAEILLRATGQRERAARHRVQAAEQRELAAADRRGAAQDREQAARERLRALSDRDAFAAQLANTEVDPLTGARTPAAGLTDLDHELDRCRETSGRLAIAYVDVVALETLSDTNGAGTSDELLKRVVAVIGEHLRSFDLVIRLGHDVFLCAMPNLALDDARRRFSQVAAALVNAPYPGAIRVGFAELDSGDTAAELIARADTES
jgi:diguanylate cyclase (GGDEF)-like protein